jgi:lysyl-tRNA synthetase class 2
MARIPVSSSWIAWLDYDDEKNALDVGLDNGKDYTYLQVPAKVYQAFLDAPSKGRFFITQIKNRFAESKD